MPDASRRCNVGCATWASRAPVARHHQHMTTPTAPAAASIPPRSSLRSRVLAGEAVFGLFLDFGSIAAAEIAARAGFDWVIVDLEHGMATESEVLGQLAAIQATDCAALVRVISAERMRVGRVLDLGADGVMIPRLETVDEAAETVSWMRFPPAGIRGVAAITRGAGFMTVAHPDIHTINERILGVFQVESPAAVAAADAMAAIDGVDVLFVGPADLSHAMGIPGQFQHPEFVAALDHVAAAAAAHGKAAGILLAGTAEVAAYLARGYRFLGIGSDVLLVANGSRKLVADAREAAAG